MNRPWLCSSRPGDDLPFVRRFKPREIEAAMSGFSTALETGGPRGTAYRARFADGLVATVRRVAGGDRDHDHQEQDGAFYRELQLLGRLNHRHVVRLRGFSEGHNRLLHVSVPILHAFVLPLLECFQHFHFFR
ncbi:hypothetical protein ACQ4PT_016625 [Festuca glaucescens]